MTVSLPALVAILGMALGAYAARAGGLWLMGRVTLSGRLEAGLSLLPGAILVSLVAPSVVNGAVPEKLAALATVLVAARTRSVLLALIVGVAVVWAARLLL